MQLISLSIVNQTKQETQTFYFRAIFNNNIPDNLRDQYKRLLHEFTLTEDFLTWEEIFIRFGNT